MATPVRGTVVERKDWADGLITLTVEAPNNEFVAGQFINVGFEVDGKAVRRSYSIAEAPGKHLCFYLTLVDTGVITPLLFKLQVGDSVDLDQKALGMFTQDHLPESRDIWLLGTGTGLGPYISMLREGKIFERYENIIVVHGVRESAHLGYKDEILELAKQHPEGKLRYIASVTRDRGLEGSLSDRFPQAIENGSLEKAAGLEITAEHSHVMLCGNGQMIKDTIATLEGRGLKRHRKREPGHITMEKYS